MAKLLFAHMVLVFGLVGCGSEAPMYLERVCNQDIWYSYEVGLFTQGEQFRSVNHYSDWEMSGTKQIFNAGSMESKLGPECFFNVQDIKAEYYLPDLTPHHPQ